MTRLVQRVRRDLHEIADHAPLSQTARDSILARVDASIDHSEREVVMLDRNTLRTPRRMWAIPVAVAAAVALAVGGIVITMGGGEDDRDLTIGTSAPTVTGPESDRPVSDEPMPAEADEPVTETTIIDEPVAPVATEPPEPPAVEPPTTPAATVDEISQLSALPWASPDDAHATPLEAVQAFVGFLAEHSEPTERPPFGDVVFGDYAAEDERSGEITITGSEEAFRDVAESELPSSTVALRQAGGSWWVAGATSDTLRIDAPAPDATFGPPMTVSGEGLLISDAIQLHVFVDGRREPLASGLLTGGGVFARGPFEATIDPGRPCRPAPEATFCDERLTDWQVPVGEHGVLVFTDDLRVATVPIVFGA